MTYEPTGRNAPLVPDQPDPASKFDEVTLLVKDTANRAGEAFQAAKKPGMPLSVLANVAREAPLASLLAAFIVGVMVGRR